LRWPRDTFYPQKLALTSPTSGDRSVGIVRLRTKGHGVWFIICRKKFVFPIKLYSDSVYSLALSPHSSHTQVMHFCYSWTGQRIITGSGSIKIAWRRGNVPPPFLPSSLAGVLGTVQWCREGRTCRMEGGFPWCQESQERQGTTTKAKTFFSSAYNVQSFVVLLEITAVNFCDSYSGSVVGWEAMLQAGKVAGSSPDERPRHSSGG
jgi:hypothetical protein